MGRSELDELFLDTTNDIQEKISRGTKYGLQRAAGLLRHLLTDRGEPLIVQINRTYRMPITFEVKDWPEAAPQPGLFHLMNPKPDNDMPKKVVKRDQFLSQVCLLLHEHTYRTKDIIEMVAHVRGAFIQVMPRRTHNRRLFLTKSVP